MIDRKCPICGSSLSELKALDGQTIRFSLSPVIGHKPFEVDGKKMSFHADVQTCSKCFNVQLFLERMPA